MYIRIYVVVSLPGGLRGASRGGNEGRTLSKGKYVYE